MDVTADTGEGGTRLFASVVSSQVLRGSSLYSRRLVTYKSRQSPTSPIDRAAVQGDISITTHGRARALVNSTVFRLSKVDLVPRGLEPRIDEVPFLERVCRVDRVDVGQHHHDWLACRENHKPQLAALEPLERAPEDSRTFGTTAHTSSLRDVNRCMCTELATGRAG